MKKLNSALREWLKLQFVFIAYLGLGTLGYWLLEPDWTLLDCIYFTIVTASTVGFGIALPVELPSE